MRILLAVDGSDESMEAASFLTRLPLPQDSQLTVATVVSDTPMGEIDAEIWVKVLQAGREAADRNYQAALSKLGDLAAKAEHVRQEGHPNRVLLDLAKKRNVDLIVVGARGHSLIARTLLGSTSDYVTNHARCPVLVVRPGATSHAEAGPMHVILAYDGSNGAKVACEQLFAFAWSDATQIQLTTLLERPPLVPEEDVYDEKAIAVAEKGLQEAAAQAKTAAHVVTKVRETVHVGDALAHLSLEERADLIFVGETGRSALAQFFLGSAARHILHHSSSSVWVARRKQW